MSRNQFLTQRWSNSWQTILLFIGMLAVMLGLGYSLMGVEGLVWAAILGCIALYMSMRVPVHIIMRFQGARAMHYYEAPELFQLVEHLAKKANLASTPALYYLPTNVMNAFAAGSKKESAIAITRGLLAQLSARIKRRDGT